MKRSLFLAALLAVASACVGEQKCSITITGLSASPLTPACTVRFEDVPGNTLTDVVAQFDTPEAKGAMTVHDSGQGIHADTYDLSHVSATVTTPTDVYRAEYRSIGGPANFHVSSYMQVGGDYHVSGSGDVTVATSTTASAKTAQVALVLE